MKVVDLPDEADAHFDPSLVEDRGGFRWVKPYWKLRRFRVSNPGRGRPVEAAAHVVSCGSIGKLLGGSVAV